MNKPTCDTCGEFFNSTDEMFNIKATHDVNCVSLSLCEDCYIKIAAALMAAKKEIYKNRKQS